MMKNDPYLTLQKA